MAWKPQSLVPDLSELIELGDSNEMLREVDRRCANGDWEGLLDLSIRCRRASVERGKPLWGAAVFGEYRLALEAPPDFLEDVIDADTGPFALGPLAEVGASTHGWSEIHPPLSITPAWGTFIYERVIRGEHIELDDNLRNALLQQYELPLELAHWEPHYVVATYRNDHASFPRPSLATKNSEVPEGGQAVEDIDDPVAVEALKNLVRTWQEQSNGTVAVAINSGSVKDAVVSVDPLAKRIVSVAAEDALNLLAWAGASGGVHGRRSGMSYGRAKLWWLIAATAGAADEWPLGAEAIGELLHDFTWFSWDLERTSDGFVVAIAAFDAHDQLAFAIYATDQDDDIEGEGKEPEIVLL